MSTQFIKRFCLMVDEDTLKALAVLKARLPHKSKSAIFRLAVQGAALRKL